jgi:hypothetical protein
LISSLVNTPLPLTHLIATNFVESLKDVLISKVNGQLVGQVYGQIGGQLVGHRQVNGQLVGHRQVNGQLVGQFDRQFGGQVVGQFVCQFPDFDQIEDEARAQYQQQPT